MCAKLGGCWRGHLQAPSMPFTLVRISWCIIVSRSLVQYVVSDYSMSPLFGMGGVSFVCWSCRKARAEM